MIGPLPRKQTTSRSRRLKGIVGAGAAALAVAATPALAAPAAPHLVVTGATEELVILENYNQTQAAAPVSVEVLRDGLVIGRTGPHTPGGLPVEINHPTDPPELPNCWNSFTPDIVNGDIIRITQNGVVETSEVRNITVQAPVEVDALTVQVHGTAQDATGTRLPIDELEVRMINPAFGGLFGGGPFILAPGAKAGPGGSVTGSIAYDALTGPEWTATFVFTLATSQDQAMLADPEAGWLGATEGAEVGVGPGAPEPGLNVCTEPSGAYAATRSTPNVVSDATPTLVIQGAAALDATTVEVTLSDGNGLTNDPVATGTLTQPAGVGGKVWTATFTDNDIDNLDDGLLTATPRFNTGAITGLAETVLKTADGTPPVTITNPTNGAVLSSSAISMSFASAAPDVTFECRRDAAAFQPCTSPHVFTGVPNGGHTLNVRAVDGGNLGTPAAVLVTVARPVPVISFTGGPTQGSVSNIAQPTFSFTASPAAATFECNLDGGGFTACSSPFQTPVLGQTPHSLEVRGTDDAGNAGGSTTRNWTVDLTAPQTTLVSGPPADVKTTSADFSMTSNESPQLFECRLDGGPFQACTSPHTITNLSDGAHTVQIRAKDQAGNVDQSPVTVNFTVKGPPNTFFNTTPPATTTATSAAFGFISTDPAATFECSLDGAAFTFCVSPVTVTGLAVGSHTFRVRAVDVLSTPDPTPATHAWEVVLPDTEAPTVTSKLGPAGKLTVGRNGIFVVPTTCDEACTIVVRARVVVTSAVPGGKTRVFRLTSTPVASAAGTTGRPRVKLNAIMLRAVRASLRAGKNVRITLVVSAKDAAGNEGIAIPAVTLTRRNL